MVRPGEKLQEAAIKPDKEDSPMLLSPSGCLSVRSSRCTEAQVVRPRVPSVNSRRGGSSIMTGGGDHWKRQPAV